MQIIILGMHRSGTSCISRLLNMMGAYFAPEGKEMALQPENPKGFCERVDVMRINDEILKEAGGEWCNVAGINLLNISQQKNDALKKRAQGIVLGLDGHRPWFLKDPRMCLVLPFWQEFLEIPVYLHVYRNPIETAHSLKKRNNIPIHIGLALWEYYTISALNASSGSDRFLVRFQDVLEDPESELRRAYEQLKGFGVQGLRMPTEKAIRSFVDPSLAHMQFDDNLFSEYLNQQQLKLVKFCENFPNNHKKNEFIISENSKQILENYFDLQNISSQNILLNERLQEKDVEMEKLQHSLSTSNTGFDQTAKDLTITNEKRVKLETRLSKLGRELDELQTIRDISNTENQQLRDELVNINKKFDNAQEDFAKLHHEFEQQRDELNHAVQENEELQENLNVVNDERDELQAGLDISNTENQQLRDELVNINKKFDNAQGDFVKLHHEFEQQRDELNHAVQENEELQENLNVVNDERDELQAGLDISNKKNQKFSDELTAFHKKHTKLHNKLNSALEASITEKNLVQQELNEICGQNEIFKNALHDVEEKLYILLRICELLDSQFKELQEQHKQEKDKVAQYDSWLREINRDILDIFSSARWIIGSKLISSLEVLMLRFNQKTAKDHINEMFREYDSFLSSTKQKLEIVDKGQREMDYSKWRDFCGLVVAALKNPAQTARLLDAERLKNLYITLFKQTPHVRENIFDYYLKLYGKPPVRPIHPNFTQTDLSTSHETTPSLPQTAPPQVSIIIPVFNQWDYTEKCIQSVIQNGHGTHYEIILADDHSTDDTVNAAEVFPGIRIVKTPENCGFLKNCNNAAKHAHGDYLVFLNNDTLVHENWLQSMLAVMNRDPKVGMTGSKLIYSDGKLQEAGGIIWNNANGWNFGRLDNPEKPEYNYVKEVDYISGASIMIRASLWNEIGGFDERYVPAYYEDTDLAFEVRSRGYQVVFTPFSVVTHFEGQSHGTDESSGVKKYQRINKQKFVDKWSKVLAQEHLADGKKVFYARDKSRNKKTMLVIDHYVPHYDKDAGSRSTFQYLQWFVECGLNVKFLGDNFYQHEPYTSDLQKMGIEVLYGPWYAENWQQWIKKNGSFLDYVYLHRPHIAPKYIDTVRKHTQAKLIYFGHDLHYVRCERQYKLEKTENLKKAAEDWKKKEFAIFEKVDVIYYPSFIEEVKVKKYFPQKCVRAIPLNIYDTIIPDESRFEEKQDLMFVGGFGHPPNLDAVMWFAEEIFPKILSIDATIRFIIAGSKMPDQVKKLKSENIIIAGEVSDAELEDLYRKSRVAVVPLRYGAGIKGKILESLRMQVPVVTTNIGAEGLPEAGKYLKIANDPEGFAESVMDIYRNKNTWDEQARNGVDCLNTFFSKQRVKEIWSQDLKFQP